MPEVDYMILADYVRQDSGVTHIMGAGVDTITTPRVPAAHPAGVVVRLTFGTTEPVGESHQLRLTFCGPDARLLELNGTFVTPPQAPGVPEFWRTAVSLVFTLMLPLPQYGDYCLDFVIDDEVTAKSVNVRVIPPAPAGP
jgi:hypothetical protein